MRLKIACDDARALVFEHRAPEVPWVVGSCVGVIVLVAVLLAMGCGKGADPYVGLTLVGLLLATALGFCPFPYHERLTIDRALRRFIVQRKRLFGATCIELPLAELRAITIGSHRRLLLDTGRRKVGFPMAVIVDAGDDRDALRETDGHVATLCAAVGLPCPPPSLDAQGVPVSVDGKPVLRPNGQFMESAMKVLRQEADLLVLEDKSVLLPILVAVMLGVVVSAILLRTWSGAVNLRAAAGWTTGFSALLGLMLWFWPIMRQFAFDRYSRRLLVVRKTVLRTTCKEFDYDGLLGPVVVCERSGKSFCYRVKLETSDKHAIGLTPSFITAELKVQRAVCDKIAAMVHEALRPIESDGLASPEPAGLAE